MIHEAWAKWKRREGEGGRNLLACHGGQYRLSALQALTEGFTVSLGRTVGIPKLSSKRNGAIIELGSMVMRSSFVRAIKLNATNVLSWEKFSVQLGAIFVLSDFSFAK
jgi:hypothetical protein